MTILNDINQLVDVLRNLTERGIKCNLLVGAGCSVTANIPTANGIIDIISERFPSIYSSVSEKTYANCMNALSPDERIDLIKSLVNESKLNITHIIIAELLKRGYVHRILTPNFDNLLIKACSVVNEYPPIYDLAAYEEFKPEHIPEKCIFYLHGQFTGFKLMNTQVEVTEQAQKLKSLFHRLNERSVWIIVGFSGLNDALFQLLSGEKVYSNRLYWIGYNMEEPHEELQKHILKEGKYGFYIKGFDSDGFFWNLANRLNTFPPTFLLRPFSYIKNIVDQIVPYQPSPNLDLSSATNSIIQSAIDKFENDPILMADCYFKFGLYDNVINMEETLLKKKQVITIANSYFLKAYGVAQDARNNNSIQLYYQSIELYDKSINLSDYHMSQNNSGNNYYELSKIETEKYEEHILEALRRYLVAIKAENKFACGNFRNSAMFHLKKIVRKNELLEEIKKLSAQAKDNDYEKYFDWISFVTATIKELQVENQQFATLLLDFQELIQNKIQEIDLKKSG